VKEDKATIWHVDDEQVRHDEVERRHGEHYNLRHFYSPDEVLEALEEGEQPDLLLSDLFFPIVGREGEVPAQQEETERIWQILGEFAESYRAVYQPAGLELAAKLRRREKSFPNLIYSSKAPLLLSEAEFSQISKEAGPVWLFKGREDEEAERLKIDAVLMGASWRRKYLRLKGTLGVAIVAAAVVGWFLGMVLAPVM
jgi:CheY-like chemotaxis protein